MWLIENDEYLGEVDRYSRAVQFGDGLFETLSVQQGRVIRIDLHAHRLEKGMVVLGLTPFAMPAKEWIQQQVDAILHHAKQHTGIVKIMVVRAPSARGYAYDPNAPIQFITTLSPAPNPESTIYVDGIDIMLCETRCSIQPTLAGIKHLNRLENVLARQEVVASGVYEGLMLDANGYVIEGTMTNLFLRFGDAWCTPSLNDSGVAGIMREHILQQSSSLSLKVEAGKIHENDLQNACAGFICNSVLGVVPIKTIQGADLTVDESLKALAKQFRVWGGNE